MIKRNNIYKEAPFVFQASISRLPASFSNHSFTTQKFFSLLFSLIFPPANQERTRHGCAVAIIIVTMEQQLRAFSFRENDVRSQLKHHRRGLSLSLEKKKKTKSVGSDNPNPLTALGFRVRNLYGRTRFSNGPRMNSVEEDGVVVMNTNSVFGSSPEKMAEFAEKGEEIEVKNVGGTEEKGRESSCSSDFLVSETTRPEEQSPSSTEDSTSCPISPRWSVQNGGGAKKPRSDSGKMEKQQSGISEIEVMKERFSKLLLGEDMSGSGNGVSTALAISNAITNLCATLFGQLWRLEPLPPEKKAMWRREMEWLLCVSDHIVEMTPSWQTFPDGSKLEIMTCRPRSDLYVNLPALRKLDNMLLEILESFKNTEFWYVDQGISAHESTDGSTSFRRVLQRQEEKWWLPVPRVSPGGLHENSRKQLQHKRDCTNQILKAVMAINSITLADMEIPESYLESLPKNGRACLGDLIYRYISSDQFSPECLLDCLDLSSEHQAIEIANRVEASIYLWRKRTNSKLTHSTSKSSSRSSWEMVKELMVDAEKRELLADRSESLLLSLKQRFPGLPQTALDMSKIQCNKDVGKSILEGYSRVLESLAFNIVARIDDLLYVDNLTRHSDQLPKMGGAITHKSVALPISAYATPSYSPAKLERSSATSSPSPFKIPSTSTVKRVLTDYLTADPRSKDSGALSSRSSPSQSQSDALSLEQYMKESLSVSKLDPGI